MKVSGEALNNVVSQAAQRPANAAPSAPAKGAGQDTDRDGDTESKESAKTKANEKSGGIDVQA